MGPERTAGDPANTGPCCHLRVPSRMAPGERGTLGTSAPASQLDQKGIKHYLYRHVHTCPLVKTFVCVYLSACCFINQVCQNPCHRSPSAPSQRVCLSDLIQRPNSF